ncbi:hypothetical protein GRI42_10250 [Erythrobacter gaetbuli]|uniref:Uncharacterized protein n=1 Tax=Qipengyuania gaetbuli TaxID=266952 RepID=A0A844Y2Z1_9SPHN|nr:hypothetical protein [Qipengyuania gaetbuli]MXO51683.1 hypothetical protein [Qipengyuania gaetbuli]
MAETRRRIRGMLRPWFDMTTGPRGFVVGRFVCIWSGMGAHNQPECVALIRRNGWTSRIQGMTFSLATSLALLLLPALGTLWAASGLMNGSLYPMGAIPILALSLAALVGGAWLTLRSDPNRNLVVKALRREFEPRSQPKTLCLKVPAEGGVPVSMDVSGSRHSGPIVPADLLPVLDALEDGTETHVILSRSETEFMQCAPSIYGFTIELRAAGDDWPKLASRAAGGQDATFQLEEVKQVLSAYVLGAERFDGIDWS